MHIVTNETVGRQLQLLRLQRGWTQVRAGNIAGVSAQQWQKYEKGENKISFITACRIADGFGVPITRLVGCNEDVPITRPVVTGSLLRYFEAIDSVEKQRVVIDVAKILSA